MVWTNDRIPGSAIGEQQGIVKLIQDVAAKAAGHYEQPGDAWYLPAEIGNGNFRVMVMRGKRETRVSMREGDRILINKGISKKVFVVARVDVPHSSERVFVSKSGGKYTIGLKVWRTDYAWSEKNQMWVPKH
jgi:hypothetical protein